MVGLSGKYCNIRSTTVRLFNGGISRLGLTRYTSVTNVARGPSCCSPLHGPRGGGGGRGVILSGVLRLKCVSGNRCSRTLGCRLDFEGSRAGSSGVGVGSCCVRCLASELIRSFVRVNCDHRVTEHGTISNNLGVVAAIGPGIRSTVSTICRGRREYVDVFKCEPKTRGAPRSTVIILSTGANTVTNVSNNLNGGGTGLVLGHTAVPERSNSSVGPVSICTPTVSRRIVRTSALCDSGPRSFGN